MFYKYYKILILYNQFSNNQRKLSNTSQNIQGIAKLLYIMYPLIFS